MRLGIVSTFPPYRGGIAQFNAAMVSALEVQGHEVVAVTWRRQYPELLFPGSSQLDPGASLDQAPVPAILDSLAPWTWKHVAAHVARHDVDVLVLPFWHAALAPALGGVATHAKRMGVPRVWALMHNANSHEGAWWHRALTARFLRRVDRVVALSSGVADALKACRPITLFHPLMNQGGSGPGRSEARRRLGLSTQARVHLFFGLIRPYKGLHLLLEALASLGDHHHLVIAGECYGSFEPYARAIQTLGLEPRVHVHQEFIETSDVPVFMDAADDMVLPYLTATQSGVTALALHHRLRVIASDVGDLRQTVVPELTGRLVPPNNPAALADAMDRDWSAQAVDTKAAFAQVAKRLSWSEWAVRLTQQVEQPEAEAL